MYLNTIQNYLQKSTLFREMGPQILKTKKKVFEKFVELKNSKSLKADLPYINKNSLPHSKIFDLTNSK